MRQFAFMFVKTANAHEVQRHCPARNDLPRGETGTETYAPSPSFPTGTESAGRSHFGI
jgi:hypothetical protein